MKENMKNINPNYEFEAVMMEAVYENDDVRVYNKWKDIVENWTEPPQTLPSGMKAFNNHLWESLKMVRRFVDSFEEDYYIQERWKEYVGNLASMENDLDENFDIEVNMNHYLDNPTYFPNKFDYQKQSYGKRNLVSQKIRQNKLY